MVSTRVASVLWGYERTRTLATRTPADSACGELSKVSEMSLRPRFGLLAAVIISCAFNHSELRRVADRRPRRRRPTRLAFAPRILRIAALALARGSGMELRGLGR